MSKIYQKMYATLAGRVDTSISNLVNIAILGPCYNVQVLKIAEDLRQALMEAEDMYLDADGET
jgi:hypothetical protein